MCRSHLSYVWLLVICFFKQKTAYEMRISDWSSDVCSSDLTRNAEGIARTLDERHRTRRIDITRRMAPAQARRQARFGLARGNGRCTAQTQRKGCEDRKSVV